MEIVTIPIVWMTYQVPGDVTAILGAQLALPPQIVLEHLVAKGIAKRLGTVNTFNVKSIKEDEEEDDDDEPNLWIGGKGEE